MVSKRTAVLAATLALSLVAASATASAAPAAGASRSAALTAQAPSRGAAGTDGPTALSDSSTVRPADRDRLLPAGWRSSADLAWTTSGDSTGLHLLIARADEGYTWRTAATVTEPDIQADQWIGNACITASGKFAVVVYQPRHFSNREHLFAQGAFAAVVDLTTGSVRKLGVNVTIAYYNPGCGAGEDVVLTQPGRAESGRTRLHVVNTRRATIVRSHELRGQLTSAVPHGSGVAAVAGGRIISIAAGGGQRTLARTRGVSAFLTPDGRGGLAFLEPVSQTESAVSYLPSSRATSAAELARGPLTELGLAVGGGQAYVTGSPSWVGKLPPSVRRVRADAHAQISTRGQLAITLTAPAKANQGPSARLEHDPGAGHAVTMRAKVTGTGRDLTFRVSPYQRRSGLADQGRAAAPMLNLGSRTGRVPGVDAAASPTNPIDDDRSCSVPRNDVGSQVEQPHWLQVEWAADLAVQNALTITRPTNWRQSGLSAWSPQGILPSIPLAGGGRVPAQVLLGILAQESNLWQASWHALEGVPGNPLVGKFYGVRDSWNIDWEEADCGYGVGQVTDGMRLAGHEKPGETARPVAEQRAIAIDYATNIAASLRILQQKWNQTYNNNIRINNADPAKPENWFAAVWAYNSGVNPQAITGNTSGCTPGPSCTDDRGNWGLGWSNNPANPDYPFNRRPFLNGLNGEGSPADAAHPERWSYPEKVMGWAAFPIVKYDYRNDTFDGGYLQAWWTSDINRTAVKPPNGTFCTSANNCSVNPAGQGACGYSDFHCWWHWPATWKSDCANNCGYENLRFSPGAAEPPRGTHYPPVCSTNGLPQGALIVDDVPASVGVVRSDLCGTKTSNNGTFAFQFSGTSAGLYPSKIDLHQIGSGLNGHFWFAHERNTAEENANRIKITGTWRLGRTVNSWARVFVHMPTQGAHTQQAHYTVDRGANATPADTRYKTRTLQQRQGGNRWVPLGVFNFRGTPQISLSNITLNSGGLGVDDVAWDAVAFQLLPGKPGNFVVTLGDSYASGEGASENASLDYYYDSDNSGDDKADYRNSCHRSRHAWSRRAFLKDDMLRTIGERADSLGNDMDYHLIACSGAQTENLLPSGSNPISNKEIKDPTTNEPYENAWNQGARGGAREVSQLDKGFLDENTTLVTLSIGGNDSKWSDALAACLLQPVPCMDYYIDQQRAADYLPLLIQNQVKTSVATVLRAIRQAAPNAKIILMGYPELISSDGDCLQAPVVGYGVTDAESRWMNEIARLLGSTLSTVAAEARSVGIQVHFADPIINGDFGGQAVCGNPETIHGIVLGKTAGEDQSNPPVLSQQSFHPKITGTANYARTLNRELRNWGL